MKRLSLVFLLIIMSTISLIVSGCGGQDSKEPAKETAKETEQKPAQQEVINLKYSDQAPEVIITGKAAKNAIQKIEERSGGRVKITPFFSGSLISPPDTIPGVANGIADIAFYGIGTTQGVHSLNTLFGLPFTTDAPNFDKLHLVYQEMLEKFPELQQETEKNGVKYIAFTAQPASHLSTTKKPVKVPDDLKGMKIVIGGNVPSIVSMLKPKNVGIIPSVISETYTNLERGLAEGLVFHFPAKGALKYIELLKFHTLIGNGINSLGAGYIVNLKTWNSLPPDIQKIITEAFKEANQEIIDYNIGDEKKVLEKAKADGHTIIELTPAEKQKWYDLAQVEVDKWIKDNEAKGLPAQKIYDGYLELLKKYK